ncbi:hypothetical protein PRZ48_006629 [Zasmidium cellare]|uniref:Fe2OG dioxygenase domain-containing protein n=1 Tax=Zasmidium cellare TaxID=395010 RepID=A0ABR0EPK9_ZASCE|nr:hypothetical protein PRZ48_006629 [Zasmidium cellare]
MSIPILNLSWASDPTLKPGLLQHLKAALFDVGFLYVTNHGVEQETIDNLKDLLPELFALPSEEKAKMSKLNSPHFLGYSGFAEERTIGKPDLREQFDLATDLPVVYQAVNGHSQTTNGVHRDEQKTSERERDFSKLYWRLRGPNQFPPEGAVPGFRKAFTEYHDAVQELSYRFVHLVEEAFGIPIGTFDHFFGRQAGKTTQQSRDFLPPQHRIKLLRYPPSEQEDGGQGVGAHKDSSGWLTFLYQVGDEPGLEVLSSTGKWLPVRPIKGSFVVNFGNAFDAATEGAVKATIHRVISPGPKSNVRYSIPFFQGLPLDMSVSEVRSYVPESVRRMRREAGRENDETQSFLDPRWDSLGESQLRKWIRSHKDVALKHYGQEAVNYYTAAD